MKLFDVVEVLEDLPQIDVPRGSTGTIVEVYGSPIPGFEVEFEDEAWPEPRLCGVRPEQLRVVWSSSEQTPAQSE